MPILDLNIQAWFEIRIEFEVLSGFFEVVSPMLVAKPDYPLRVFRDAPYFFGKIRDSTSTITWMTLLLRRGDRAMISEAAAMPIATIAAVVGSIVKRGTIAFILVSPTDVIQVLSGERYDLPSFLRPFADHSSCLRVCKLTVC